MRKKKLENLIGVFGKAYFNADRELRKILLPYSKKKRITFKVSADLRWGFP